MDRLVIENYLDDPQTVLNEILAWHVAEPDCLYDNPFEKKWVLDKQQYTRSIIGIVMDAMIRHETCWWVQRLLNIPIDYGDVRHYGGVFVYQHNDYLKPHCDAGIHPYNGQRKVATACLYLTPATLYFYKGDVVWLDNPLIHHIDQILHIPANSLVLFKNHDTAWHEVPLITNNQPRAVITVSYMAPPDFKSPFFMNQRTRAYFARHMSIPDSKELAELRDKRASEEHHESVYRMEVK